MVGLKFIGGLTLARRHLLDRLWFYPAPTTCHVIWMSPGFRTTQPGQNERNAQPRSADFQSPLSPSFTRQGVEYAISQRAIARSAECNSAIQQIENLRYDS